MNLSNYVILILHHPRQIQCDRALLWGKRPRESGGSLRDLDGFPVTHSCRLWSWKVGCLVSITVTCTFLKSNRFLLVGVFIFCRICAARLTQRLNPAPSAADTPDNSLESPASCSQKPASLFSFPPSLSPSLEAERSLSRPPPTSLP